MCTLSQKCGLARCRRRLLQSPKVHFSRDRSCALPTHRSCADLHERGPELHSLSSDHYEPTLSLLTLWVKKRLLSCRPLRVRSLLASSTARHLGTPCVRWGACASCPSSVHTRVSSEEFRSSTNLEERAPSSKFFHPTGMFVKVSFRRMRLHPSESSRGFIHRSVALVGNTGNHKPTSPE